MRLLDVAATKAENPMSASASERLQILRGRRSCPHPVKAKVFAHQAELVRALLDTIKDVVGSHPKLKTGLDSHLQGREFRWQHAVSVPS